MATRANLGVGIIGSTAKAVIWVALATLALGAFGGYAFAQQPAAASEDKVLSKDELNALVGKIALYPDDLVAIVLPASTYPLQVVEAARFLEQRQKDPSLKPSDKWDDSVVALLNYPEVVKLMNNDLDWTWKLGDAVINQRGEVLDAIQGFRTQAAAAGNLHTDEHQVVQNDDQGEVSIKPADPQVVYVPYYDPEQVVVEQPTPVYYYYPYGYPLYYYPYPYGYPFAAGYFWGVTTAFVIGWHNHYVHVVHCGYPGHPYYGHTYYGGHYAHGGYYVRHDVNAAVSHGNYVWEPHYRAGSQPFTRSDGRQLAIAHRDQSAGGAPSGYQRGNQPPSTAGWHAGNPGVVRGDGHGALRTEGGTAPGAHPNPGFRGNGQSVGPSGARDGMKQIQPIRNDPPTQAAIRSELREHAPNQASFNGQGPAGAHATAPGFADRRYSYPAPNQSTSLRDPAMHGAPQFRGAPQASAPQLHGAPQFNTPQVRGAPQIAPQVRGAPQASAPQMHTMPMPSAPPSMGAPRQGGASYVYRSPSMSMPQSSAGHAPVGHQGGAAHGSQGHGGGGGRGSR
jgi:uncharacterized protein DUF3300